jgi:hypothetical protein
MPEVDGMFKGEGGQAAGSSTIALHSCSNNTISILPHSELIYLVHRGPIYILFLGILGFGKDHGCKTFCLFLVLDA